MKQLFSGDKFNDTANYHCSGADGNQYDRDLTDGNGRLLKSESSSTMFPGTDSATYN